MHPDSKYFILINGRPFGFLSLASARKAIKPKYHNEIKEISTLNKKIA
jgi:hypothetical protein